MIQQNKPVYAPYAMQLQYRKELYALIEGMDKDFRTILNIYRKKQNEIAMDDAMLSTDIQDKILKLSKRWQTRFNDYADKNAKKRVEKTLKQADSQLTTVLAAFFTAQGLLEILKTKTESLIQVMKVNTAENVSLIKSIPEQYVKRVQTMVTNIINGAGTWVDLRHAIIKSKDITLRRAKMIARDQTNKVFNAVTLRRFEQLGITKVKWKHSHADREPRHYHITQWDGQSGLNDSSPNGLDGFEFDLNNPPIIDKKTGQRGFPGTLINCYHKDAEVYTERGFVPVKDVCVGEKVLTLNPSTKNMEWSFCDAVMSKYCENISVLSNRWFKLAVDKNHRFFMYKPHYANGKDPLFYKPAFVSGVKNIGTKYAYLYAGSEWVGTSLDTITIGKTTLQVDDYLRFMGYYLSEGSRDRRKWNSRINIAQYKYVDIMLDSLSVLKPHKVKKGIDIYNKDLWTYCAQFGFSYEKYVPQIIKEMPAEKIRIFLDAFALGDGTIKHVRKTNKFAGNIYNRYYTSSKRLADDLSELIIKCGMAVNISKKNTQGKVISFKNGNYTIKTNIYWVCEKKTTHILTQRLKVSEQPYNDMVYDISVRDNHTLLIKFDGFIAWNSNCSCMMVPIMT